MVMEITIETTKFRTGLLFLANQRKLSHIKPKKAMCLISKYSVDTLSLVMITMYDSSMVSGEFILEVLPSRI